MTENSENSFKSLKTNRIILPVLLGLGVVCYLLWQEINADKVKITALNFNPGVDWYSLVLNENEDTAICYFTDSLINKSDTCLFELHYFMKGEKDVIRAHDIFAYGNDTIIKQDGIDFPKIEILWLNANTCQIAFYVGIRHAFSMVKLTKYSIIWLFWAVVMMAVRDLGYMLRLRVLADNKFSWRQAFRIIMLWEFTSAVTPSAIGGTSIAVLFVHKEGLSIGRSTAVVLATSFLDEIYFILMFPLLFTIVSARQLFSLADNEPIWETLLSNEFFYFAAIGFVLKFVYVLFILYGLFINPRGLKWLLLSVFRIRLLRRWRKNMNEVGDELIISSRELKSQPVTFWAKAFGATFFSWSARYWVVNMLLLAFFGGTYLAVNEHFLIFSRQLVMWIMMLISPTPGGSGFAEFIFSQYLSEFIPIAGFVVAMALIWRLITYYPYLFIGVMILPRWLSTNFRKKNTKQP